MNKFKTVFLDRDGVLNQKRIDHVKNISELKIFPFVSKAIKKLQLAEFKIIVITNQSAINRGLMNHQDLKNIHKEIQIFLSQDETKIDSFYYCPHTPNENCLCRKPKTGLLLKAIHDFSIDVKNSWFVGDSESDILTGQSVGCKTIKINDSTNLERAVDIILTSD